MSQPVVLKAVADEDASALCTRQIASGDRSNYKKLAKLLAPVSVLKKDSFETTEEFEQRKLTESAAAMKAANLDQSAPLVYASVPIRLKGLPTEGFLARYDADSGVLDITIVDPTSRFYKTDRFPASKQISRPALGKLNTILLASSVERERPLELTNIFGVSRTTTDQTLVSHYLVYEVDAQASAPIRIQLQVSPAEMKRRSQSLRLMMLGELHAPYARPLRLGGRIGTVAAPLSFEEWGYLLYAAPKCAAVFDATTNEVLKTVGFAYEPMETFEVQRWLLLQAPYAAGDAAGKIRYLREKAPSAFRGVPLYVTSILGSDHVVVGPFSSSLEANQFRRHLEDFGIGSRAWSNPPETKVTKASDQ